MLARTPRAHCVECAKPAVAPDFAHHAGKRESGPAYWSSEGLICSAVCAARHVARRAEAGRPVREPAANPLGDGATRR